MQARSQSLFLVAAALALTLGLPAADAPKPLTPAAATAGAAPKIEKHDVLLMSLSINDHQILTRMALDGSCRLYLRQKGGFSPVLPSANKGDDFGAASSPDGKSFAFYSSRTGAVNLWISDPSGANQRPLTESDSSIAEFHALSEAPIQFSQDSKQIAYLQSDNLWLCDSSGNNPRALTHEQGVSTFAWSPDGHHLAYLRYGSIHLVNSTGAPDELLAADAANYPTLAFNADAKSPDLFCFYNGVWRLNTVTKKRQRLGGSFCFPNRIQYNPGADMIAYLGYSSDARVEIFQSPASKKNPVQLTQGGAASPFYSRDGKWIYFSRKGGLWRISLAGEKAYAVYEGSVSMASAASLEFSPAAAGGCQ